MGFYLFYSTVIADEYQSGSKQGKLSMLNIANGFI
jgi:hypothetical protein